MTKPRFKLRTLFLLMLVASPGSLAIARLLPEAKPYRIISTSAEWDDLMKKDRVILFNDATWSPLAKVQSAYLDEFARWANRNTTAEMVSTTLGSSNELLIRKAIARMWESNNVNFTLKGMDGAGCVVWLENGKLVGFERPSFGGEWVENKKNLTQEYFGSLSTPTDNPTRSATNERHSGNR